MYICDSPAAGVLATAFSRAAAVTLLIRPWIAELHTRLPSARCGVNDQRLEQAAGRMLDLLSGLAEAMCPQHLVIKILRDPNSRPVACHLLIVDQPPLAVVRPTATRSTAAIRLLRGVIRCHHNSGFSIDEVAANG